MRKMFAVVTLPLCILSILLEGCVAPQYRATSGVAKAKVRFVSLNTLGNNVTIYHYGSDRCTSDAWRVGVLSGRSLNHYRQRLGIPLGESFDDIMLTEVVVDAGKPSTFSMAHWAVSSRCNINVTFTPTANNMYEFSFYVKSKTCHTNVSKIMGSGDGKYRRVAERSARKSTNTCTPMLWH